MSKPEELGHILASRINTLAATFYQMNGREFMPEIDFRHSTHPEEVACWNQAVVAHSFINADPELLKHQS